MSTSPGIAAPTTGRTGVDETLSEIPNRITLDDFDYETVMDYYLDDFDYGAEDYLDDLDYALDVEYLDDFDWNLIGYANVDEATRSWFGANNRDTTITARAPGNAVECDDHDRMRTAGPPAALTQP